MAYTKTVWVNDAAPAVDATNLNKIEQGIYDAHVDAAAALAAGSVKWLASADPAAASSVSFASIAATYESLLLVIAVKGSAAAYLGDLNMRFNNDSSALYNFGYVRGTNGAVTHATANGQTSCYAGAIPCASGNANARSSIDILIPSYARAGVERHYRAIAQTLSGANGADQFHHTMTAGDYESTTAISRIDLIPASGTITGRVDLYGIKGA